MRTLLIDADSLIYAAASRFETATQWEPEVWTYHGDLDAARAHLNSEINGLRELLKADEVVLALSDYTNPWRKIVLPTYKSNRKDIRKPVLLKPLRDYCHEAHPTFQRPGLEGDDILGILATAPKPPEPITGERVVCSIDKDLGTIPGIHFNWKKDEDGGTREVTLEAADRMHLRQTLTGDTVDGYPGCPGVGPVKAEKILGDAVTVADMWPRVVAAYVKAGLNEESALVQARVARICRASDFDFKKREVILWKPE